MEQQIGRGIGQWEVMTHAALDAEAHRYGVDIVCDMVKDVVHALLFFPDRVLELKYRRDPTNGTVTRSKITHS